MDHADGASGLIRREVDILPNALAALHESTAISAEIEEAPPPLHGIVGMTMPGSKRAWRYAVEAKMCFRSEADLQLAAVQVSAHSQLRPLLATSHLTPALLEACRRLDLSAIDTSGNAFLTAPGVYVLISGKPPSGKQPRSEAPDILLASSGLRVLFNLLLHANENRGQFPRTLRDIANRSGVSLGSVHRITSTLEAQGMASFDSRRPRLLRPGHLTQLWLSGFPIKLRPKLNSARFSGSLPANWWEHVDLLPFKAMWGGETGAWLSLHEVRPATQSIYVLPEYRSELLRTLVKTFRLRADPAGAFEVLDRFWGVVETEQHGADWSSIGANQKYPPAPNLLLCGDLMMVPDSRTKNVVRGLLARLPHED